MNLVRADESPALQPIKRTAPIVGSERRVRSSLSRFNDIGPAMGQGFGLGVAIRSEDGRNPPPGSAGSFYWTGIYGTTFFVDPKEQMIIIMMIQAPSPANAARLRGSCTCHRSCRGS